ncbi:MAG: hypothetical protein ABEJ87_05955 [Candidatus Nanohalobium sp.]
MNSSTKLVLLTTLLTLSIGITAASPADLTLFPQESSARIDSFTTYQLTVQNQGPVEDVYTLSPSNPSAISIAPRQVRIGAGDSKVVNIWYNPETQTEAGRYSFNVNAKSRATGNTYSIQGFVNVIRQHDVSLKYKQPRAVCLGQTATYKVKVTNGGLTKETFKLSASKGQFSQDKVTLEDGESKVVEFYLSSKKPREASVNLVAASTTSYAQAIKPVHFKSETCYASQVVVSPESQRVAAGTTAHYNVTVRNTGTRADDFTLQTNQGELGNSSFSLPAGKSTRTQLRYTPTELGTKSLKVTAKSGVTTQGTAEATVYNGMKSDISVPHNTVQTCENTEETVPVTVENTGEASENFQVQTTTGNLSQNEVTLGKGESKVLNLSYQTGDPGKVNYQITSTATTFNQPTDTVNGKFKVQNCWDLDMSVLPEVASAGENQSQVYEIRLNNTGTRQNTYELTYEGPSWISIKDRENDLNERTVTVPAGETGYADIYAGIPFQKKGEIIITATAVGEQVKKSKTVKLLIGKDIKEAMKSDKGGAGGGLITGSFSESASNFVKNFQAQGTVAKLAIAVIIGLILTAAILYWEW